MMREKVKEPRDLRGLVFAAAVFMLFLMFMVWQVNFYLFRNIKNTYYMAVLPVLVAGGFYFWRLKNGPEYTLLVCYWLWFIASRILNGDPALVQEFSLVFDLALMLPSFLVGLVLERENRKRFLDWFSAAVGGYHFLLGLVCLAAFILRRQFVNPITGGLLGMTTTDSFERINILDINICATAFWFMMAFLLMVYQFFACKNRLWRIPIVLAGLVHYSVVAISFTRSVKVSLAVCTALLVVLLAYNKLKLRKKTALALVLAALFLASAPLAYKSFDLISTGLLRVSIAVRADKNEGVQTERGEASSQTLSASQGSETSTNDSLEAYEDPRQWNGDLNSFSSGRLKIYKGAFLTIAEDPSILLTGCLSRDAMTRTNETLTRPQPHYHNFILQVLIFTGLPGLLLILALVILVVIKAVRLFFSRDEKAETAVKLLALPITGTLIYSLFESCLFTGMEVRPLYFYILCGALLGFYYDVFPRKSAGRKG